MILTGFLSIETEFKLFLPKITGGNYYMCVFFNEILHSANYLSYRLLKLRRYNIVNSIQRICSYVLLFHIENITIFTDLNRIYFICVFKRNGLSIEPLSDCPPIRLYKTIGYTKRPTRIFLHNAKFEYNSTYKKYLIVNSSRLVFEP